MADLIQWPETAKVDRAIPKERLYAESGAGAALKQRFVDEVQRVRWAFKLSEVSLRLAPSETVSEIQVFFLDLKGSDLDNTVLAAIDKTIPSQIIFELNREHGQRTEHAMAAAHKRAGGKPKAIDYFRTDWIDSDQPRVPLPAALDMNGLYRQLLGRLLPHPMRSGENLSDALDRMTRIRGLDREVAALEKKQHAEPQLNRKIELRKQVKERITALAELTDPVPSNKD